MPTVQIRIANRREYVFSPHPRGCRLSCDAYLLPQMKRPAVAGLNSPADITRGKRQGDA
jgi:hypothetical protein